MTFDWQQTVRAGLLAGVLSAIPTPGPAQDQATAPQLVDPALVEAGRLRFDQACTYCHGKEGSGGKTRAFKGRGDLDPETLFDTISNGRKRGANIMPPWKNALSERERWELVAYILWLGSRPAAD